MLVLQPVVIKFHILNLKNPTALSWQELDNLYLYLSQTWSQPFS